MVCAGGLLGQGREVFCSHQDKDSVVQGRNLGPKVDIRGETVVLLSVVSASECGVVPVDDGNTRGHDIVQMQPDLFLDDVVALAERLVDCVVPIVLRSPDVSPPLEASRGSPICYVYALALPPLECFYHLGHVLGIEAHAVHNLIRLAVVEVVKAGVEQNQNLVAKLCLEGQVGVDSVNDGIEALRHAPMHANVHRRPLPVLLLPVLVLEPHQAVTNQDREDVHTSALRDLFLQVLSLVLILQPAFGGKPIHFRHIWRVVGPIDCVPPPSLSPEQVGVTDGNAA
mmetsp:Transcript_31364/g.78915  ORF Transcript_31364/g.78915 Transcript_31364/m.78915 type:complete len:284 (-) Transcript_31364:294-1145(-)